MANIATVSLRIIVKAGTEPIEDIEVLFALFGETSSYNVPIYLAWRDGYLDAQYGVRWSPVAGPYDLDQVPVLSCLSEPPIAPAILRALAEISRRLPLSAFV